LPVDKNAILKAVQAVKTRSKPRKFTQSMDLVLSLKDIDTKKPENRVNELIELPHAPKNNIGVTVFATGDLALRARNAGASQVLGRATLEGFANDKAGARKLANATDFFIAETTLMSTVGKILGQILGPRGKMPTPIPPTAPVDAIVKRLQKSVRIRVRDQLVAQCAVGTEDMANDLLVDNIQTIFDRLERRLQKGLNNVREAYLKTTMGPVTKLDL
jgi:large subunit ribosomal protein L1